ncbi:MAG: 4Fe-4S binding protein [Deltaproteobacteria bacterium]|nr:4Fe-4S binding protein [Deltaproteobacteria bacterium]
MPHKQRGSDFILRPPGAVTENRFKVLCEEECVDCLKACPPKVIRKNQDSFSPDFMTAYVDIRLGGCDYCEDFPCVKACQTGALDQSDQRMAQAVLLANCLSKQNQVCEFCLPSCPDHLQALKLNELGLTFIDSELCVGCGKCVSRCFLTPKAIGLNPLKKLKDK